MRLKHICEVCGCEEVLDSDEAFELGWDYPPRSCSFGMVAARTCPKCSIDGTLWWALAMEGISIDKLSEKQAQTLSRIRNEPLSIMPDDGLSS